MRLLYRQMIELRWIYAGTRQLSIVIDSRRNWMSAKLLISIIDNSTVVNYSLSHTKMKMSKFISMESATLTSIQFN